MNKSYEDLLAEHENIVGHYKQLVADLEQALRKKDDFIEHLVLAIEKAVGTLPE